MLSVLLGSLLTLQTTPVEAPFSGLFEVKEPIRLAITPKIDGKIDPEEWDPLSSSGGLESFFQWEPGSLFIAAKAPAGKDVVLSIDMNGDGWLIGNDNLQLRISQVGTETKVVASLLDGTDRNGPRWTDAQILPGTITTASSVTADSWTAEMKFLLVGLPGGTVGTKTGFRADLMNPTDANSEPFVPRKTALLNLQMEKTKNLAAGFEWRPDYKARTVVPGETIRIKVNLMSPTGNPYKKIDLKTEGLASDFTKGLSQPLPNFDKRGRSAVEYETPISTEASIGYRVLQARLIGAGGEEALLRTSYLVSDVVMFDPNLPDKIDFKASDSQIIRGSVTIRSQTMKRVDGKFTLKVPSGWTVSKGIDKGFGIYHARGSARVPVEIIVPVGAKGLFPLEFTALIGDKLVTKTMMVPVK